VNVRCSPIYGATFEVVTSSTLIGPSPSASPPPYTQLFLYPPFVGVEDVDWVLMLPPLEVNWVFCSSASVGPPNVSPGFPPNVFPLACWFVVMLCFFNSMRYGFFFVRTFVRLFGRFFHGNVPPLNPLTPSVPSRNLWFSCYPSAPSPFPCPHPVITVVSPGVS